MAVAGFIHRTLVVGVGYTGSRLLNVLTRGEGISRGHDWSDYGTPEATPNIVYTAPPAEGYLESILEHLDPAPRRFVYISTTGVYGNRDGDLVSELDDPAPESPRAERRVGAELQLESWCIQHAVELVILRVPGIYGPGRLGIDRIREGVPVLAEEDANPGNRIHVDDLVSCCVAALHHSTPAGIYNVGDGDTRSSTWFANEVARQCGLPTPPTVSRAEAEKSFSKKRLSFLRESRRLDLRRMRDILGVIPQYRDASSGIAASLDT